MASMETFSYRHESTSNSMKAPALPIRHPLDSCSGYSLSHAPVSSCSTSPSMVCFSIMMPGLLLRALRLRVCCTISPWNAFRQTVAGLERHASLVSSLGSV